MRSSRLLYVCMLTLILLSAYVPSLESRNTHGVSATQTELAAWWADAAQPYVETGCVHETSVTTSAVVNACKAYTRDAGPPSQYAYIEDIARTVTYSAGDGTYWLIAHQTMADVVTGWTRVNGTHYLWMKSATYPTIPSRGLLIMQATVLTGAISAVDATVALRHPYIFDGTVYATRFGMLCDGVTDNSAALALSLAALPLTGGNIQMPASRFSCKFGTKFVPTKPITLTGAGGEATARFDSPIETTLEYTGADAAIEIGVLATGSVLQSFSLNHSGTATAGIRITGGNNTRINGVSIVNPTVKFSRAGIEFAIGTGHSHSISQAIVRDAAPTGVLVRGGIAIKIIDSAIHHHENCNAEIGDITSSPVKDFHIFHSRMELNTPHDTSDSVSLCVRNVEGFHVTESHFELGIGAAAVMRMGPTDKQCEQCFFRGSWISLLSNANVALHPTGIFVFDAPGTVPAMYLKVSESRIFDTRVGGNLLSLFNIANTSGNGGVGNLIIEDNEIPITTQLQLINDESLVNGSFRVGGNWQLGAPNFDHNVNVNQCLQNASVGNVGAGEDNLMAACTTAGRRFLNGSGFRTTAAGKTASNGNNKQIRARWNGVLVWDSGVVAANDIAWRVECTGVLANASAMSVFCQGNPLSTTTFKTTYTDVTVDFATPLVWQVTGEAVANNDIVQLYQMKELTKR